MTEKQREAAASSEAGAPHDGSRKYSRIPKEIEPHPEHGGLPPCEMGMSSARPCPRSATTLMQGMYVCDEHFGWMNATESRDEAEMGVYHAKRMLWRSQVQDIPRLEHHISQALIELEREQEEATEVERAAWKRANRSEADPDVR